MARNPIAEHVLSSGLRTTLSADGFAVTGRAFHRTTTECLHVVDVQASRTPSAARVVSRSTSASGTVRGTN